jgi:hypothetical protein
MELYELDDLIMGLGIEPTTEQLNQLYSAFENDFIGKSFSINGLRVKVILRNARETGYETYPETFVHLITRKSGNGKRIFDRHRANKIHWVKCILENRKQEEVIYFRYREANNRIRDYYWYKEGGFVVIMEQIAPEYLIVTSFHVDAENKSYFEKKEKWYRQNGT